MDKIYLNKYYINYYQYHHITTHAYNVHRCNCIRCIANIRYFFTDPFLEAVTIFVTSTKSILVKPKIEFTFTFF